MHALSESSLAARPLGRDEAPPARRSWGRRTPAGLSFSGDIHDAGDVSFLADKTWVDPDGERQCEQEIFDVAFGMIRRARTLVLLDMFLYNEFEMRVPQPVRSLSRELTDALIRQKREYPGITAVVITDPINTVYGSLPSAAFGELRDAGIRVVTTDLTRLRDSSPVYSALWRLFVRPFGNSEGGVLRNPFSTRGKVTIRSYLEMLNFKGNHRKLLVADDGETLAGLVTSANPHDASSANANVAVRFTGPAAADLLTAENAVLALSGADPVVAPLAPVAEASAVSVQVLTERAIKTAALTIIGEATKDDCLDLATFFVSDREIIAALKAASLRGVSLRALLDPNKDSFGYRAFGIPNRPAGAELRRADIPVRWCDTHGEQCHVKMLIRQNRRGDTRLLLGSANLTRRNLDDFNLEANVLVRGPATSGVIAGARAHFELLWNNRPGQAFSVPYEHYRDESLLKKGLYRFMEATGLCTF